ncbi:MAG: hypothetical protein AAF235_10320 [Planctomycetota bacterium]
MTDNNPPIPPGTADARPGNTHSAGTVAPPPGTASRPKRGAADTAGNERATWLTGAALAASLVLILAVLAAIVVRGMQTFWPGPIERIELASGEVFLGSPAGSATAPDSNAPGEEPSERLRFQTGNRDLGGQSFRWIDAADIVSRGAPMDAVLVERNEWGVFIGTPKILIERLVTGEERVIATSADEGFGRAIRAELAAADRRLAELNALNNSDIPRIEAALQRLRWDRRDAERRAEAPSTPPSAERASEPPPSASSPAAQSDGTMPIAPWILIALSAAAGLAWSVRSALLGRDQKVATPLVGVAAIALAFAAVLEHPWRADQLNESKVEARLASIDEPQITEKR